MDNEKTYLLIGNSRWHWAFLKDQTWEFIHTKPDPKKTNELSTSDFSWAAVGPIPKEANLNPTEQINIHNIPLPSLPPWLGIDRALGALAAFRKSKRSSNISSGLIIADAGTILSLTRINSKGEFEGGQLLPGLSLQIEAMTSRVNTLNDPGPINKSPDLFPKQTHLAMQRGALQALIGTLIQAEKDTNMQLWICGGDSGLLVNELKKYNVKADHYPNLVLEGMIEL